ncbi:MAG: DNA mismatch repair protein MutS [Bacteroidales bacterium]
MKQYYSIKEKHPDAVLLFRVGDFYETFGEDAIRASSILGITLTRRANGAASYVELAGFPHHALDSYLPKLVRAGQRVAICEQLEDPKATKKIVKRGITELVTPGVSTNDNILEHNRNNYLASLFFDKQMAGIAFLDISTGEFATAQGSFEYVDKLISSLQPKEIVYPKGLSAEVKGLLDSKSYSFPLDEWIYTYEAASDRLLKHFEVKSLKGFGVEGLTYGIIAAGAILHYMDITEHKELGHISGLSRIEEENYVWLDRFTIRNLELFNPISEGAKTLCTVIDKTVSPMGSRLLKRWLALPLKDVNAIDNRLSTVEFLLKDTELADEIDSFLKQIGDLERLISKVAVRRISPREMRQLGNALKAIAPIKELCSKTNNKSLKGFADRLNPCELIQKRIETEIVEDAPNALNRGKVIADGISKELDELRLISGSGKSFLDEMQARESKRTGISSLKIAFNNVFGYYIEVRNTHKDKVPPEWIRKQTLVSAERYITEELKEYETKILGAEEKIAIIEERLYNELVQALSEYIQPIQVNANTIAQLDCLSSFKKVAEENNYVKPSINNSKVIDIKDGRHPVIEQQLTFGETYIPNDVLLSPDEQQIIIITGPNMAGKSALLRQTALIVLMAQVGCFIPAKSAEIGLVDKIFTRVGASDNISSGESTFMVEMNEASSILNNLSDRSLVLFDELGRGTSTYDGISIAWAIVEYIHNHKNSSAKTMFATHYHELNEMEKTFPRVKNYNVSVKEHGNKVIFLRKLVRGGSNHSFGIHVAQMAGMPPSVVKRAEEVLVELEENNRKDAKKVEKKLEKLGSDGSAVQLSLFQLDDPVLTQIKDQIDGLDINNLTPIEALNKLDEIKRLTGSK